MRRCLSVLLSVTAVLTLGFQDETKSGPQVGEYLPGPFHPFNVTGPFAGRPHCLVCEHGLHPVVTVLAREPGNADGPLMKLLKGVDEAVEKSKAASLGGFAVFLSDESQNIDSRGALAKRLRDLAESVKLKDVVLSLDSAAGPKEYNISKEVEVTVLLYHKHRVAGNFTFKRDTLNDEGIKTILAAVEKMAPAKPAPAKKK